MSVIGRLVMASVLFAALGCGSRPEHLDEFVTEYVRSVHDGTEFYERYTAEEDLEVVQISRPKTTADFEVTGWDYHGPGDYSYAVAFSNGATAVVTVYEREGEVEAASLTINRQPAR